MDLHTSASQVRENAYAPYSGYQVGAALLGSDGAVYRGCNVENLSYGATICAERNAVLQMVGAGCTEWRQLIVVTKDGGRPCGLCLQVLSEFLPKDIDPTVQWATPEGILGEVKFSELLPSQFLSQNVRKG